MVDPSVSCTGPFTGTAMVLVGEALYDVTDPVHPRLVCTVRNSSTKLFTADTFEYIRRSGADGTEVVLHSIGSGNERVVAGWPLKLMNLPMGGYGVWTSDGNNAATFVSATDAAGNQVIQVWLFAQPIKVELYEFPQPLTDCICRFGIPPPTLAFSADGQYLLSGWPVGKGAQPLRIYKVADASFVETLDISDVRPLWSPAGHELLHPGSDGWQYVPSTSPDGLEVAYTAYQKPYQQPPLGVYVYDITGNKTQKLTTQNRSEVTFVKDGWVWYWEEVACADCAGQSTTGSRLFAMDLSTGVEQAVVFAKGESPVELKSGWSAGEFWPNS